MKTESDLFNGFTDNRASKTFALLVKEMGFSNDPVELLVNTLSGVGVTAIYVVKNLFIIGNIVDLHVVTPEGDYGMRITENEDGYDVRVSELTSYQLINTFTLSKLHPSGLPDGA